MDVVVKRGDLASRAAGVVAIGIFENEKKLSGAAAAVDRASRGAVSALLKTGDFRGAWLQSAILYPAGRSTRRVLVLGMGKPGDFTAHRARQLVAVAAKRARDLGARTLATVAIGAGTAGLDPARAAQVSAEGAVLGHWRFEAYRTERVPAPLQRVELIERDAVEIGRAAGARVEVMGVPQMERLGMGALLGVGRGSVNPPRFVVLDYDPRASAPRKGKRGAGKTARGPSARGDGAGAPIVIIGKGITFDTGGISLKPRENMHKMKYDMSGAAAVLGVFSALPTLGLDTRVIGLVASAENMPGGRAFKPGDVLRALDGTTIEITNTDAEGRLVLADALGFARRFEPGAVVDLATLTGAISIALGNLAAGLYTDDDTLAAELTAAGGRAGERLWRMPVWDEFASDLRSDTADLVNSSGMKEGGANVAAVFLKRFARGMRWAHLDIASTAWSPAERPHESRGPTGFGVRLLLEWLSARAASAPARTRAS